MKLSDSPFAVGTPEHGAWVRTVYIPTREFAIRHESEPQLGSAASVGRKLIDGRVVDAQVTKALMARLMGGPAAREPEEPPFLLLDQGRLDIGIVGDPEVMRRNEVRFFMEDFTPIAPDALKFIGTWVDG